jgi:hypothetical protein
MDTKIQPNVINVTEVSEDTTKQRHLGLHVSLDRLSAAYLISHPGSMLGGTSVVQLLEWSETEQPDLYVQLIILAAQFADSHMGAGRQGTPEGVSLNQVSLLALIVWSGRRDYKGN